MGDWALLAGGGLLLYLGAEWFVGGASTLALALRVPQLLVGLTVVAYGTSAPEIVVGVEAARAGHGEVALGNVLGSNIANVGLILGVAALVRPARVDGALRRRELPVLLLSTALVPVLLWDGSLTRMEAGVLLLFAVAYTVSMVRAARASSTLAQVEAEALATEQAADVAGAPAPRRPRRAIRAAAIALAGLALLIVGGNVFVGGAVATASALGMSERLVGVTIVAVGTSLPELVTSVVAARRGHSDIAVGNVVGSNIFNILLCLGLSGMAGQVGAPLAGLGIELVGLLVTTVLAGVFIRTARTITRVEAGLALGAYAVLTALVIQRG